TSCATCGSSSADHGRRPGAVGPPVRRRPVVWGRGERGDAGRGNPTPSTRELVLPCRTRTVHATSSAPTYEFACRAVATRRSGRDAQNGGPPTPPVPRPASHSEPNSYTRTHLVWCTLRVRHRGTSWRRRCGRGGPEGVGGRDRARPPPDAPAWRSPAAGGCGRRQRRAGAAGGCGRRLRRATGGGRVRQAAAAGGGRSPPGCTASPQPAGPPSVGQLVHPNPPRTVHATSSALRYEFAHSSAGAGGGWHALAIA